MNYFVVFGSELRGRDIESLIGFGAGLPNAKFACLGDYVNSRGAADMGLLPDLLPGYVPVGIAWNATGQEYGSSLLSTPGLNLIEMFDAASRGELGALYVVGSNPVSRYGIDPKALAKTFMIVQDMFLTETALLADVVLPKLPQISMKNPVQSPTPTGTCNSLRKPPTARGSAPILS